MMISAPTKEQVIYKASRQGVTPKTHLINIKREVEWVQVGNGQVSRHYKYTLKCTPRVL